MQITSAGAWSVHRPNYFKHVSHYEPLKDELDKKAVLSNRNGKGAEVCRDKGLQWQERVREVCCLSGKRTKKKKLKANSLKRKPYGLKQAGGMVRNARKVKGENKNFHCAAR